MNLNKFAMLCFACAFIGSSPVEAGSITITVTPWLAPNAYGSPNFAAAADNAIQGQYHGLSSYGTPGTPAYYQASPNVWSSQVLVTSFPSWLGVANPGAAFGPAFAGELGNRMHFGLLAVGSGGTQFSLNQLSFSSHSSDPGDGLQYAWSAGGFASYSTDYQGILFGADDWLGSPTNTFITSGSAGQLVDAIVSRGSGNSYWPYDAGFPGGGYCSSGCSFAQQQALIDQTAAWPGHNFQYSGTYSIDTGGGIYSGTGTFNIAVPEPLTLALFGGGLLGAVSLRRRRAGETAS